MANSVRVVPVRAADRLPRRVQVGTLVNIFFVCFHTGLSSITRFGNLDGIEPVGVRAWSPH